MIVVELTSSRPAAMTISIMDAPAPTRALAIGIIAAANEPRTTTRTMTATTSPASSTAVILGMLTAKRSPPMWTSLPGIDSWRSSAAVTRSSRCSSVNVETVRPSTRTLMSAAVPSSLIRPLTYSL